MKNFSVTELWDLRAELDGAIMAKKYDKINDIQEKYNQLVEGEKFFNRAFICYNHAFWTESERSHHNMSNIESISRNIAGYHKRYVDGEQEVSLKLKTQYSTGFLAGDIWTLRAMYDKFLYQSVLQKDELQTQQHMILGKAILEKLRALACSEQLEDYHDQILPILRDVRESYEMIYQQDQPKTTYNQLAEEYLES